MYDKVELYDLIKDKPDTILAEIKRYSRLFGRSEIAVDHALDNLYKSFGRDTNVREYHRYKDMVLTKLEEQIDLHSTIVQLEQMLKEAQTNV